MTKRIPGIPTTYKGIRFRSRLEAKWAAFFDLLGWKWEYEPFDASGWIPDFGLTIGCGSVLVEVKPIQWDFTDEDAQAFAETATKVRKSVTDTQFYGKPILIVGTCLVPVQVRGVGPVTSIGKLGAPHVDAPEGKYRWGWSMLGINLAGDRRTPDLGLLESPWKGLFGDGFWMAPNPWPLFEESWSQACNEVQWKKEG